MSAKVFFEVSVIEFLVGLEFTEKLSFEKEPVFLFAFGSEDGTESHMEHLPGIEFTHHVEGLVFRETAFAAELGGGKGATFVRMTVENPGRQRRKTRLVAVMLWNLKRVLPQVIDVECRHSAKHRRVLDADGNLVLFYDEGGRFRNGLEKTVTYTLDLGPGESRDIEFRMPRCRCSCLKKTVRCWICLE